MKLDTKSLVAGVSLLGMVLAMLVPFGTCASRSELQAATSAAAEKLDAHARDEKAERRLELEPLKAVLEEVRQDVKVLLQRKPGRNQ